MANDQESRGNPEDLGQDPYVERRRPDPSQPPEEVRIQEGLLGDSDREGYKRLYFTRELDHYAEFRTEDVTFTEPIAPDQPPFLGQQATRVGIKRNATIEYTRVRTPRPVDEFDLDVRLGMQRGLEDRDFPPFMTHQRTECFLCLTEQGLTQCIPCNVTHQRSECFPCITEITCGIVCGGRPVELRPPDCTGRRTGCLPA
jgi:hypothetical protein